MTIPDPVVAQAVKYICGAIGTGFLLLCSIVGFFMRRIVTGFDTTISEIRAEQARCQRELPREYAGKKEFDELGHRVDRHGERISTLEERTAR